MTLQSLEARVRKAVGAIARRDKRTAASGVLLHSERLGLHLEAHVDPDAFHAASVGKLFTATLVARAIDAGRIGFDTRVAGHLPAATLDRLFVIDGADRQAEVTVDQLLRHTSGVADYFADRPPGGTNVAESIASEPERSWDAATLLQHARQQPAVGAPGGRFHYSDTGYVLLGRLVEEVEGAPFEEVLHREIFDRLGMSRSWMPQRTSPTQGPATLRPAWLGGAEVSTSPAITADWTGGGVASTERDLLRFSQALWAGELVAPGTLETISRFDHRFRRGFRYGAGLMQYRFGELFFMLSRYPAVVGHMGVIGTYLVYDANRDLHIVVSVGPDAAIPASVRLLIAVLGATMRLEAR